MTVSELIELLEEQDPEAIVLVMTNPEQPRECELAGMTVRNEFEEHRRYDDDGIAEDGTGANDVFLVVECAIRPGSKNAWNVAIK
jgi:hypothetical protein